MYNLNITLQLVKYAIHVILCRLSDIYILYAHTVPRALSMMGIFFLGLFGRQRFPSHRASVYYNIYTRIYIQSYISTILQPARNSCATTDRTLSTSRSYNQIADMRQRYNTCRANSSGRRRRAAALENRFSRVLTRRSCLGHFVLFLYVYRYPPTRFRAKETKARAKKFQSIIIQMVFIIYIGFNMNDMSIYILYLHGYCASFRLGYKSALPQA